MRIWNFPNPGWSVEFFFSFLNPSLIVCPLLLLAVRWGRGDTVRAAGTRSATWPPSSSPPSSPSCSSTCPGQTTNINQLKVDLSFLKASEELAKLGLLGPSLCQSVSLERDWTSMWIRFGLPFEKSKSQN